MTEGPEWQKGFPIERLKALAAPFKERHKALVFGAFGLTKERDIADALAHDRLAWTGSPPTAVAIVSQLARDSDREDFAQRKFVLPAGTVLVKAFAAKDKVAGAKVLDALRKRAGAHPFVVEIFEEDDIARACVAEAGFVHQATRISAGSEIKGFYSAQTPPLLAPILPEDRPVLEVLDAAFVSADECAAILSELDAYGRDRFAQHYSDYNKRKSWTAFALRGYSDDPGYIIKPAEMSKAWKDGHPEDMRATARWTSAVEHLPATRAVIDRLSPWLAFDRVRFMRLRAKDGELSRHADITDREAGTADGFICRLHIPIRTSDAVTFYGWTARGEKVLLKSPLGCLMYLDQRKPHAVANKDLSLDRIHLVIDVFSNDRLRQRIAQIC